jgi:hypothetical protein
MILGQNNSKQTLITDYFNKDDGYKQTLITDYYRKSNIIYGFNPDTLSWHCLGCGVDLGVHNPRQFCMKSFCPSFY